MKYFIDNNLPEKLANAIREIVDGDYEVIHLKGKFPQHEADEVWIKILMEEGDWVIITQDGRIKNHEIWKDCGLTSIFLAKGYVHLPFYQKVGKIIGVWPSIVDKCENSRPGSVFTLQLNGKLK